MNLKGKTLRALVAAGLVLAMTTGLALASIGTGVVTAGSLRLRSDASTSSTTLKTAPKNSTVTILEQAADGWYKVSYKNTVGYMSADWLDVTPNSGDGAAAAQGTVNTATLNVRSGPGVTYARVGTLKKGAAVTIVDDSTSGWYQITSGSLTGYVSADYITPAADSTPAGDSADGDSDSPTATQQGTVNTATLNVRSGPGTGYSRVGSLKKGAAVTIVGSNGSWYQITSGSISGYVSADYITVAADNDTTTSGDTTSDETPAGDAASGDTTTDSDTTASTTATQGTVNTATLNVRSGPGTGYSRVATLKKGASVTIVDDSISGWYQITSGSVSGYVSADYISFGTSGETRTGLVTTASLNVRSGPGTGYGKVGSVKRGASVTILADSGSGWYQIRSGSLTGYVSAGYVTILDGSVDSEIGAAAAAMAVSLLGSRYVYGAEGPNTFDCSGLFYYIFRQLGHPITRTSSSQYNNDGVFVSSDSIQPGDLVFFFDPRFDGSGGRLPTTHVGMYVGNNQFIHASTTTYKVQYDALYGGYYGKYIVGFKRIG